MSGGRLFSAGPEPPAVNRVLALGVGLVVVGLTGYASGVSMAYPGRSLSLTLLMVGIALIAMRGAFDPGRAE